MKSLPPPPYTEFENEEEPANEPQSMPEAQQPNIVKPIILVTSDVTPRLGPDACRVVCPICKQSTLTKVNYKTSMSTHWIALWMCFLGCFCLSAIPYCIDSCKNAQHYCSNCDEFIGTFERR